MSLVSDLKILWHLAVAPVGGATHAERMDNFYRGQSAGYDAFRERLLHGRSELIERVTANAGGTWVDLGGGTGANLAFAGHRLPAFKQVYIVDLARSLLKVADDRAAERGWTNVSTVAADATRYSPPGPVDLVTFSYSLTMIPDWFAAIDRAWEMLRPGQYLGVVDFYVGRKFAGSGRSQHHWLTRSLLPLWFGADNVFLSDDHIPYLQHRFETVFLAERRGRIPWLPGVRAPHYLFVGRKSLAQ
jgi:S-adenosylmethionine-diacylgycerolhomoserine-N-methlytransferase